MKKLLGIFLLAFVIVVGFSGTVAAASFHGFHKKPIADVRANVVLAPSVIIAPIVNSPGANFSPIINSPGSTIAGRNVDSNTGGNTVNAIGSTTANEL